MSSHFCKRCGAPVKWVLSEKGIRFPIEESSDPQGTFLLKSRLTPSGRQALVAVGLSGPDRDMEAAKGTLLFRHHQAVCFPRSAPGRPLPRDLREKARRVIDQAQGGS